MPHEFDGKKYEKASSHQKEWGNRLIAELDLKGNERILDLGCGDGKLTESLAELVPDGFVLGVDASQGMIDVAKTRTGANLEFRLLDINDLNLTEKFDLIFSNAALHWIKDHQKLWENVSKILSDKGVARFNFAADGNCQNFFRVVKKAIALEEFADYFKDFQWPWYMPKIEEYRELLEQFAFSETKVWEENADRTFPDSESITAWINQPSIVPFLGYLPEEKKESFREYVVENVLKDTANGDGGHFETFRRVNVFVRG